MFKNLAKKAAELGSDAVSATQKGAEAAMELGADAVSATQRTAEAAVDLGSEAVSATQKTAEAAVELGADAVSATQKTAQAAKDTAILAKDKSFEFLEEKMDLITDLFMGQVTQKGVEFFVSDEGFGNICSVVHEALPLPVRLAVGEERFVEFCVSQKNRIHKACCPDSDSLDTNQMPAVPPTDEPGAAATQ